MATGYLMWGAVLYKIWDRACPIPICHVTTRVYLKLVGIDRDRLSSTWEGLYAPYKLGFHVTLSPKLYKGGQDPLQCIYLPQAIQTIKLYVWYYATHGLNLSNPSCCLHHRVPDLSDPL